MTATTFPEGCIRVIQQVVLDPRFRAITRPPRYSPHELGLVVGSYMVYAASTSAYLYGLIPYWLALICSATSIFTIFTPLHDAGHGSASSSRVINDLIGNLAAVLLLPGVTIPLFRQFHLEHHRYTGEKGLDPDHTWVAAWWPLRILSWTFLEFSWVVHYFRKAGPRPLEERRKVIATLGIALAFQVAALLSPWGWEFFILWMVPQRTATTILVYLFGYMQHPADVEQRQFPLQATRMIKGGPVVRILMLGQAQHLMHHLFPAVPFYRYNDAWRASRHLLDEHNLVWQTLFGWAQTPRTFTAHEAGNGLTLRARISAVESVAEDVRCYELSPIGSVRFSGFSAGSHIDVEIAEGLVRQYSLCGSPECPDRYRIAVRRDPAGRGGSQRLHESFTVGRELRIGQPRNHFPLDESGSSYYLVAGGIGVTPLLAMSRALETKGKSQVLHVCARNAAALPFGGMLGSSPWTSRTHIHLDDGADSDKFSAVSLPPWRHGMQLYLCGPRGFMAWVITLALARGWPDSAIRTETFSAPTGDPALQKSFEVVLRKTGRRLNVPADRTLLEVLKAEGLPAVASCTQGLCGACRVNVLEGDVDHRDRFFSDEERRTCGQMTVCVSRATGTSLVLDL